MTLQFNRQIDIQVNDLLLKDLQSSFRVVKTLKKEPNTCELTIYNLSDDHRDQIAQTSKPVVEILAGYMPVESTAGDIDIGAALVAASAAGIQTPPGLVFLGNVRDAHSVYEPPKWITTIESGDGEKATRLSRINKSFTAGTSLDIVIAEVAKSMQVGIGNALKKAREGKLLDVGSGKEFLNSLTLSGQSAKELNRIVKSAGLEWSIQDGVLQLLEPNKPLEDISIVLTPTSGMIGSPQIGNDGIIRVRTLLNSDIVPGRQIEIQSKILSQASSVGGIGVIADVNLGLDAALGLGVANHFRVERVEYTGSNFDNDFYCDIEAKEL